VLNHGYSHSPFLIFHVLNTHINLTHSHEFLITEILFTYKSHSPTLEHTRVTTATAAMSTREGMNMYKHIYMESRLNLDAHHLN
jgi:hypothetical protein